MTFSFKGDEDLEGEHSPSFLAPLKEEAAGLTWLKIEKAGDIAKENTEKEGQRDISWSQGDPH